MVSQKENRLDFASIMNGKKVFLAKLAQGAIGEENAYLLGALLVSKLHQIAQSRQEMAESERSAFYLYIDEFHNFLTPSMAAILSGARKYHLGLVLAHQDLAQLGKHESGILGAAFSNPATRVCFRVGDMDARRLEEGFSFFEAKDLQSLGVGEAICRIDQAQYDFNLKTRPLFAVEPARARERRDRIVALSRGKYALPRQVVEASVVREVPEGPDVEEAPVARAEQQRAELPPPALQAETRQAAEPPVREKTSRKERAAAAAYHSPGRGGDEHKRLQHFIKRWAESRGYRATIEKSILDGQGSIDVAVEKGEISIAFEVTVTTSPEQDLKNVQKCLSAGFNRVVVVAKEPRTLKRREKLVVENVGEGERERVSFLTIDELPAFLERIEAAAAGGEATVLGYKVKTEFQPVSEEKRKTIWQSIVGTVFKGRKPPKLPPS